MTKEAEIEKSLIDKLTELKYTWRPDIRDRESLEQNFREKFQALNRVSLTETEFARLRDEIINALKAHKKGLMQQLFPSEVV